MTGRKQAGGDREKVKRQKEKVKKGGACRKHKGPYRSSLQVQTLLHPLPAGARALLPPRQAFGPSPFLAEARLV